MNHHLDFKFDLELLTLAAALISRQLEYSFGNTQAMNIIGNQSTPNKVIETIHEISRPIYTNYVTLIKEKKRLNCVGRKSIVGTYNRTADAYFQYDFQVQYEYTILGKYHGCVK